MLNDHLQAEKIPLWLFFSAAWAVTLRCFTECERVYLWVGEEPTKPDGTVDLLTSPIDAETTMRALCQSQQWTRICQPRPGVLSNVGIVFEVAEPVEDRNRMPSSSTLPIGCDLALCVNGDNKRDGQPLVSLHYRDFLLSPAAAINLADTVQQVISSGLSRMDDPIVSLQLCSPAQYEQIHRWSPENDLVKEQQTVTSCPPWYHGLCNLARLRPDQLAIDAWNGEWTYHQLYEISSRVAALLQHRGIGPGMMIPVCYEKSAWAIAAAIGVHKTGAAFVPLDPGLPASRLQAILETVQAPWVVTSSQQKALFETKHEPQATVMVIDAETADSLPSPEKWTGSLGARARDPAYGLFVSGSTGRPKGCVVSHGAFASIAAHAEALQLNDSSRALQFASLAFGVSINEIYGTLAVGGTICLLSDADRASLRTITSAINRMRVTWAVMTPTMMGSLLPSEVPCLRTVLTGGEPLHKSQVLAWADAVHLHQVFGFTEWAGTCCVSSRIMSPADRATIGRPVPNARVWLVDPDNNKRLAPIGAVAELCVEGACLAQGYIHDSAGTSDVFVRRPDWGIGPYDGSPRMYRTGDLVRYRCDGQLTYLGRKDTQRKIRGQRVELAEVEYHLRESLPDTEKVLAEVITPLGNHDKAQQVLAAFVLPRARTEHEEETALKSSRRWFAPVDASFEAQALVALETLRARLPRYMVPDLVLRLRGVPLTISGEVDRRRLCTDANRLTRAQLLGRKDLSSDPSTDPGTETPLLLQLVLCALNLPPGASVGMGDNFFHLGGDSIKAMKLVGLAHPKGLPLTVSLIFKHPVFTDLQAALLTERGSTTLVQPDNGPTAVEETAAVPPLSRELVSMVSQQYALTEEEIEDVFPCSPLQEGMMALSIKSPGAYIARLTLTLRAGVDLPRACAAWEAVMHHNEIFRTRIVQTDSQQMLQVVMKQPPRCETCATQEEFQERLRNTRMGLGDPLVYSIVITGPPGSTQPPSLAIVLHHSIGDRWSLALARQQLDVFYARQSLEQQNQKVPRFRDFITHIRAVQGADKFWRAQFAGLTLQPFPAFPAPTYEPSTDSARKLVISIPPFGRRANYTLSTVIQLAWAVVVSRYTNSRDVVYGLTVTGRAASFTGIESIVGPTVATVPLRIQLNEEQAVEEALTALQLRVTDMAAYEQTGLQHIRNLGADAEAACQFQNHLVVQFSGDAQRSESSASVIATYDEAAARAGGFASYPLLVTCQLSNDPHTITVTADFDSRLIPAWKVERVLWTLETTLGALIKQPRRPVRDLPALSTRDHQQLLEWAPTPPPEDAECLHRVIRQNVLKWSSSEAVCAWDGRLSYHELWALSGYLARYLHHQQGVGPEVIVPLLFEKSQWLPVSILAVMRAGGAYILLDPLHPPSRLRQICEAVGSPFLVASQALTGLGQQLGCCSQVVTVAPECVALSPARSVSDVNDDDQEICPEVQPSNTVYIVFTSGSTGNPKGVVVEHRTYCSSARAHIPGLLMSRTSRVLQWAACAFDLCCLEILSTLLCGGCICIPQDTRNVDRCVAAMNELQVTLAVMTPSFARALQHQGDAQTLQTLVLGGEAASEADICRWPLRVRLLNAYGPAECSVVTTVQSDMRTASSPGNIGFPTNARCWLVHPDDPNRLVPIGAVGEMLVEGPLVGRGYLNDHVQTASVFLQPPRWLTQEFAGLPQRHLYRTGDLMYRESDGSLCFVGRKDFQIKLRGQRIELGEIEKQMQRWLRDSLDVVAELITPVDRSPLIVAFIWEADDADGKLTSSSIPGMFKWPTDSFLQKATALDSHLRQVLPASMVPSLFLPVRSMPRAQTGKTNRRLLRQTAADAFEELLRHYRLTRLEKGRGAPSSEVECTLHRIWAKVLKLPAESIGLDANFFHLGGDSISAMYLAAAARAQGLALAVSDILESPQLATMASRVAVQPLGTEVDSRHPSITPFSLVTETTRTKVTRQLVETGLLAQESQIADILPVTEGQSFFLTQWTPVHHCYFIQGPVDVDRLRDACEAAVARHSILRTAFVRAGDVIFQAVMQSIKLPFRTEKAEDLSMYCDSVWEDDCAIGSTVNQAPLRFILVSQSSTRHVFIMRLSHAQYDGVSLPVLLNDMSIAYSGDPLFQTLDFCSYVHYRSHHDHGPAFSFWRNYLRRAMIQHLPFSPFSSAFPPKSSGNPPSNTARITTAHSIVMPDPPPGITTANLVKAATAWVMHQRGSPADLVLGQAVTGRSMALPGIDTVLGACLNIIPFRVTMQPAWTVMDLLKHVQQQSTATLGYDFMDFSDIVRHCTDWPQGTRLPCVIQHQNVDQSPKLVLRDVETTTTAWSYFIPPSGLWIMSAPRGPSLQVLICTSERVMSRSTAKELVDEICDVLAIFASSPDRNLCCLHG
ncbi:hypothetical protein CNMCM6805_002144 [Aspergillus fumigatiaffinis]|uniref:Carrier domain-containing protein n=1 Tax=Aspergillus fumigatiaffinis TaxID=340414 RepID=A0A8H4M4Y2_9EURO|nr:hypothetical protein CNMCM6805_002144 [Aspergillus fumigatiaffinis]